MYKEEKEEYCGPNENDINYPQKEISKFCYYMSKMHWKDSINFTKFASYSENIKVIISSEIIFLFYDLGDINGNYSIAINNIHLNKHLIIY